MKKTVQSSFIFLVLAVASIPAPALAIQTHSAPEGLYVHQIGHILFTIAMIGFALRIMRSRLAKDKAWYLMTIGAFLFALWNAWAFAGHILVLLIDEGNFVRDSNGFKSVFILKSPIDYLYYLAKMDHLICVPALLCFFLALKRMNARLTGSQKDEADS